jgi:hypothetical protein
MINEKYNGVNWYRHHLDELKTVSAEQTKQYDNIEKFKDSKIGIKKIKIMNL